MMTRWMIVGSVFAIGIGACGSSADGGSSTSGVSSDKSAAQINETESKQVCEWLDAQIPAPTKEQACTLFAVAVTSTPAECKMSADACAKQADDPQEDDADDSCANGLDLPEGCTATVGELEACVTDSKASFEKTLASLSCDDAGKTAAPSTQGEKPASCKTLDTKCPGWDSDSADRGSATGAGGGGAEFDDLDCGDGVIVPGAFVCDGEPDCDNKADELGC